MRTEFRGMVFFALALASMGAAARADLSAGHATFTDGSLSLPGGMAVDAAHRVYVVNAGTHTVDIFDAAHAHVGGFGATVLAFPQDIALAPNGSFYVADSAKVQAFDAAGNPGLSFGTLNRPGGIAADANSNIYVADTGNNRILKFSPSGQLLNTITSAAGVNLNHPCGVTSDSDGNLIVADSFNNRLAFFDSAGNYQRSFSTAIPGWPGSDYHAKDLLLANDGSIYLALGDPGFVHFDAAGALLDQQSGFTLAYGVALDGGTLYGSARGLGGSNTLIAMFALPEPASATLLLAAATGLLLRRHHRR